MVFSIFGTKQKSNAPKSGAVGSTAASTPPGFEGFELSISGAIGKVPLQKTDVSVRFTGVLVHTRVSQHFRNEGASAIEATYAFPVPTNGILLGMTVKIGGQTLHSEVQENKAASKIYEKAIGEGNSAFLLKKLTPTRNQMNLGNIKPGEEAVISVDYAEVLEWSGSVLRYRLPTVIPPHYGNFRKVGLNELDVPNTDPLVEYPLSVEVQFSADYLEADIASPTHALTVTKAPEKVTAKIGGNAYLDRDFILEIRSSTPRPWSVLTAPDGSRTAVLATLCPPVLPTDGIEKTFSATVVLDCSGSMAGDSIGHARTALRNIITLLPESSRLQVVCFGSTAHPWFDEPVEITEKSRRQLLAKAGEVDASLGGTELQPAIRTAFKVSDPGAEILLLTDGQVYLSEVELDVFTNKGHRIFAIGIGSAVSEEAILSLSERSGGAIELVTPNENMADRIVAHFERMKSPRGSASVSVNGVPAHFIASRSAVFPGDTIIFTGTIDAELREAKADLAFANSGNTFQCGTGAVDPDLAEILPRIVAWYALNREKDSAKAVDLALRYQLLSKHTSMVAVYERAEHDRIEEMPEFVESPQMLPAGWGGFGLVKYCRAPIPTDASSDHMLQRSTAYPASIGFDDLECLDFAAITIRDEKSPVETAAEEAAVEFATGDDDFCEAILRNAIKTLATLPDVEVLWLMLFDLYRLKGKRTEFDEMAAQYAQKFQKMAPPWLLNESDPGTKSTLLPGSDPQASRPERPQISNGSSGRIVDGVFVLSGEFCGSGKFLGLDNYIGHSDRPVIDMQNLSRLDFARAGVLFCTLQPIVMAGRPIVIRNPNRLVSTLLTLVGVVDLVGIEQFVPTDYPSPPCL